MALTGQGSLAYSALISFEEMADNNPEKYVTNPDSFLNSLNLNPTNSLEHEIFTYGLTYMAYGLLAYGEVFESAKYFEKSLMHIKQHDIKNIDKSTFIIKPLANAYIRLGDNRKAIELLENTLTEIGQPTQKAGYLNNLALAYLYDNETAKAEFIAKESLAVPGSMLTKALTHNILSTIYLNKKDSAEAFKHNQKALMLFENSTVRNDTLIWYCSALGQSSELSSDNTNLDKSLAILTTNFPNTQMRTKAKLLVSKGTNLSRKKQFQQALTEYKAAIKHLQYPENVYTLDYTYTTALIESANCFKQLGQLDSALHYYEWAIENDFRTQQLITSKDNHIDNNDFARNIVEALVSTLLTYQQNNVLSEKQIESLLWCIELSKARLLINEINRSANWTNAPLETQKAIHDIRQLYQQLDENKDKTAEERLNIWINDLLIKFGLNERYFETFNFKPDKESFLKQLNIQDRSYYTYLIHKDSSISIVSKVNANLTFWHTKENNIIHKLTSFKRDYFSNSPHLYNQNPQQYKERSSDLISSLLTDIDQAKTEVYISPDGELYGLPFDALWDNDFLVKKHHFIYINSFLLFDFLRYNAHTQNSIALLYRSDYPAPLPNLQFADQEVISLKKQYAADIIAPEDTNDSTLQKIFSSGQIIHVAAHTLIDSNTTPLIYLQNRISTDQLRYYNMTAPLVFLSACNSGQGKLLTAEGMESIQRVFLSKRVPSVISTYWFANDETMLALTSLFYKHLENNNNPAQALTNAKREYLKRAETAQINPWYWANINYSGINNEVDLKKASNLPLLVSIATILTLIVMALYYFKLWSNRSLVKKNEKTYNEF